MKLAMANFVCIGIMNEMKIHMELAIANVFVKF